VTHARTDAGSTTARDRGLLDGTPRVQLSLDLQTLDDALPPADIAVRAGSVPAYANGQRYLSKNGREREGYSDPDASWGHRGLDRVRLHADLTILAKLSALSRGNAPCRSMSRPARHDR